MKFPWKYILTSFLIGLLFGGSIGLYYSRNLARHWIQKGPEMFLRRLDHELHLSESQTIQIRTLLNADQTKMNAYHDQLRRATRAEIRTLLTADQQPRFDSMVAKHDAERQKREDR